MSIRPATEDDLPALAAIHAACFAAPWDATALRSVMSGPGAGCLVAALGSTAGFVIVRVIAGEAEILTIAVEPRARRRGMARALIEAAVIWSRAMGAEAMFLEAAEDNPAALALYEGLGFNIAGRRRAYYARPGRAPVDARVMRRALNTEEP